MKQVRRELNEEIKEILKKKSYTSVTAKMSSELQETIANTDDSQSVSRKKNK
jgi:hypothetical protein